MATLTGKINFVGKSDALLNVGKSKTLTMSLKQLPEGIAAGSVVEFSHEGLTCKRDKNTGVASKYIQAKEVSILAIKEAAWVVEDYEEDEASSVPNDAECPF